MHFSQSLGERITNIVIYFDLLKQKTLPPRQVYIVLSRVTSIDVLYLIRTNDTKGIKVNTRATAEYYYARRYCQSQTLEYIYHVSIVHGIGANLSSNWEQNIYLQNTPKVSKFSVEKGYLC